MKIGDEIFTYKIDSKGDVSIDLGKIGNIYPEEDAVAFENGSTYSFEFIAGVPTETHEKIGTFLSIIESAPAKKASPAPVVSTGFTVIVGT